MRKILILMAVIIIAILIFIVIGNCTDINDMVDIKVTDVTVNNLTDKDIILSKEGGYEIDKEKLVQIQQSIGEYKIISAHYQVHNKSDRTAIKDVRFYPDFDNDYKEKIVSFNSGNDTYYINVETASKRGVTQHIIIYEPNKTTEEIYRELMMQKVRMTYFTGGLYYNTGHGYMGLGKHSVEFSIGE